MPEIVGKAALWIFGAVIVLAVMLTMSGERKNAPAPQAEDRAQIGRDFFRGVVRDMKKFCDRPISGMSPADIASCR